MKVTWEAEDIWPGRKYSKRNIEEWIIGYLSCLEWPVKYVSISLNDGMVTHPMTKDEFAEVLNREGYLPVELLEAQP